ncbi:MAG: hypothetical protein GVY20_07545 [Bacteroidetes bacterium]|jgi:hypothetical protein|nr:hypothetical protein [Bacteroidota bacterium]
MTSEKLAAFFHKQVVLTYQEFIDHLKSGRRGASKDLRLGLLAAVNVYHFREHLEGELYLDREEVIRECADYALLRDVADVAKHRNLDRNSAILKSASAIQEMLIITIYEDEFGEYKNYEKVVQLRLPHNETRRLDKVLTEVMIFWDSHLRQHGVPLLETNFKYEEKTQPLTREQCSEHGPDSVLIRGLFEDFALQLRKYNYEKNIIEPVNLTGSKLKFQIFDPKYEIDIKLIHDETGEEITRTIVLNPDDAKEFEKLESDEERSKFIQNLPKTREVFGWMFSEAKKKHQ